MKNFKEEYIFEDKENAFHREKENVTNSDFASGLSKIVEGLFSDELSGSKYRSYKRAELVKLIESHLDLSEKEDSEFLDKIKKFKTVEAILQFMTEVLFSVD